MNLVSPLEKPRLIVTLPDSTLLLISFNLTSDACFLINSCLFCLTNVSTILCFLFFLLSFLDCLFLFTPDEKLVRLGNLEPSIFQMTKSCAGSSMHNASVVPLKNGQSILIRATGHFCLESLIRVTPHPLSIN